MFPLIKVIGYFIVVPFLNVYTGNCFKKVKYNVKVKIPAPEHLHASGLAGNPIRLSPDSRLLITMGGVSVYPKSAFLHRLPPGLQSRSWKIILWADMLCTSQPPPFSGVNYPIMLIGVPLEAHTVG